MSESNRPLVVRLEDQTPETIRECTGDNVSPLSIPDGGVIVSVWRADGTPAVRGVDFVGDDRVTHDVIIREERESMLPYAICGIVGWLTGVAVVFLLGWI